MTFTGAEPPGRVAYDLFFPDFGTALFAGSMVGKVFDGGPANPGAVAEGR